jgi:DNA-directed RNA polymerase subunit RPC12/RpoP
MTVESFQEYIEKDRLRIRSAWRSIERRPLLCPKCYNLGFNTSGDEEAIADTLWDCLKCGYRATEDKRLQTDCQNCGGKRTKIVLEDETRRYTYCSACGTTHDV